MKAPFASRFALAVALLADGCATPYAYQFQPADPAPGGANTPSDRDVVEDEGLRAEVQIVEGAVLAQFTNKGTDPIQIDWKKILLDRGDGTRSSLRPEADVGWVTAGGTLPVRLVPFTVPHSSQHAKEYAERKLELVVPMVVKNEPKTYAFHFVVHVHPAP
jgi:hypothetical protein